ncbi:MAG: hypothetical protein COT73_11395 [Bdellovibrio sp. CG10_big_fil_rev_8_21_14_0_10_47_8]|nr:MAG: hypothetical protein COT73_11395 [Bdellovibrio sp. CG10_big_fil_rev_8_21_14_0_10_47_8]
MLKVLISGLFLFCASMLVKTESVAADTKRANYMPCLKALNEKSVIYKDKIFPLDKDGWTYVVKQDNGSMTVVGENGTTYNLSAKPTKCSASQAVNTPVKGIAELYIQAVALGNDPKNSYENKKEIVEQCKSVAAFASSILRSAGSTPGMMTSVPGSR